MYIYIYMNVYVFTYMCIQVVDNGVGIEPDQQSGLFQEFNQIDKNTLHVVK